MCNHGAINGWLLKFMAAGCDAETPSLRAMSACVCSSGCRCLVHTLHQRLAGDESSPRGVVTLVMRAFTFQQQALAQLTLSLE